MTCKTCIFLVLPSGTPWQRHEAPDLWWWENVKSKHSIDLQRKTGSGVLSAQATVLNFRTSTMSVVMQRNRTNMYMQAKQWEPNQIRSEERSGSCDFDVDAYLVLPWSKRGNWLLNFLQSWAVYVMFTTTTVTAPLVRCVAQLGSVLLKPTCTRSRPSVAKIS